VETCTGNADLYVARNVTYNPGPSQYQYQLAKSDENEVFSIKDPSIQGYEWYLGVYGAAEGVTSYRITAWTNYPGTTTPNTHAGLLLGTSHEDSVDLEFTPATSPLGADEPLIYTIYWGTPETADPPYVMYSFCGIANANAGKPFSDPKAGEAIKVTVPELLSSTKYMFNVMVADSKGQRSLYNQMEIGTTGPNDKKAIPLSLILGVLFPVGAILVITIIYLCVRNRKLTKDLEIEMHDVPKGVVKKVTGDPATRDSTKEKESKTYHRLLQEEDPEDNYAPPDAQS